MNRFRDRSDAGRVLAMALEEYRDRADVIVLGLPRGGVPVAAEVASALGAPLDVFVVRKLGMPGHEEFAIGAIASGGVRVMNRSAVEMMSIPDEAIARVVEREHRELERRERQYRGVVCAMAPRDFQAVGLWYENFEQTSDQEVHAALDRAMR